MKLPTIIMWTAATSMTSGMYMSGSSNSWKSMVQPQEIIMSNMVITMEDSTLQQVDPKLKNAFPYPFPTYNY